MGIKTRNWVITSAEGIMAGKGRRTDMGLDYIIPFVVLAAGILFLLLAVRTGGT